MCIGYIVRARDIHTCIINLRTVVLFIQHDQMYKIVLVFFNQPMKRTMAQCETSEHTGAPAAQSYL